jgi:hypothetical protein
MEVAAPITWAEVNAFADAMMLPMRAWEKAMIRELDDIARAIWMKKKTGDKGTLMPATDSAGIKAFFEKMAAEHGE